MKTQSQRGLVVVVVPVTKLKRSQDLNSGLVATEHCVPQNEHARIGRACPKKPGGTRKVGGASVCPAVWAASMSPPVTQGSLWPASLDMGTSQSLVPTHLAQLPAFILCPGWIQREVWIKTCPKPQSLCKEPLLQLSPDA